MKVAQYYHHSEALVSSNLFEGRLLYLFFGQPLDHISQLRPSLSPLDHLLTVVAQERGEHG